MTENINSELEHRSKIQKYYTTAQPYYEHFWHGKALGLHYGFWINNVSSKTEAITKENEYLANLSDVKQNDLILDAGCGIGGSSIWLAKEKEAEVVGLNIVDRQLTTGKDLVNKRSLGQKVDFVKGDYQILPFKDNAFDVFWSLESIEHATNLNDFMKEAFRVLKPGGKIIIAATFLGDGKEITVEEKRQMDVGKAVAGTFNDFRSAKENAHVMNDVGFVDVQNFDKTAWVMKSAELMTKMSKWGLPVAKALAAIHAVSPVLILNNQWGTYQEGLFKSGATSYNILLGSKPK
jgi:cyclopropane fatty-acyl-phospholipid synthase-like methyltransferase